MADEFITEADLASYLREDIPAGGAKIHVDQTNAEIVDLIGTPEPVPAVVRSVALEVASRGYRNPQALTSETKTIDDFTHTTRREGKNAQVPGIYITDGEKRKLLRAAGKKLPSRYGSIRLRVPR